MCNYDYSFSRGRIKALKMRHCHEVAEMYKIGSFYSHLLVVAAVFLGIIILITALCSCKWYFKTKKNPCKCCSIFCCCSPKRRKKEHVIDEPVNMYESHENGHMWSPVSLPPTRDSTFANTSTQHLDLEQQPESGGSCMNFCLSDPVQDCCEFFDCDIMWRKKSVYTIPIFGKKKQYFHRRPTRPAPAPPPPPKAVVLPQLKSTLPPGSAGVLGSFNTMLMDEIECEPVPEAPPSPEPVRSALPSKSLYVDPLSFFQKPFLFKKSSDKSEEESSSDNNKEALYSKVKNLVLSKVKKSASTASINKLGVSCNPDGCNNDDPSFGKKMKTASLASLHNLDETNLDNGYGSKRSLSLASLRDMITDVSHEYSSAVSNDPRSRISVISSHTTDDIPPAARKDEYIDLAEMSKRVEAQMRAAQIQSTAPVVNQAPRIQQPASSPTKSNMYTPDFIPASAFIQTSSTFKPLTNPSSTTTIQSNEINSSRMPVNPTSTQEVILQPGQYYPAVPASQGKPAVPARSAVGSPIYVSAAAAMAKCKPMIPPRPSTLDGGAKASTLTRSPRPVRPTGPPPPPPSNKAPIESSI